MRRMWLLLSVFALAVPAATAAPPKQPAYHVTIQATMDTTYTDPGTDGCSKHETRHVEIRNAKPLTLTAAQLGNAKNSLFQLVATETKTLAYTETPNKCTWTPPPIVSACGKVTYKISSRGTGVGFLNRTTNKFAFFYTRIGPDPYRGGCQADGLTPPPALTTDDYPPGSNPGEVGAPGEEGSYTLVDRAKLAARKRFVVQWSESGHWNPSPGSGDHAEDAAWWRITLVPVP